MFIGVTLKAAVYHGPLNIKIEDIPEPSCGVNDVIVKVKACAICATDVKTILKGHKLIKPPTVLGHEISGIVYKVGENVDYIEEGSRVVVGPYAPCGYCYYCLKGKETLCENLFKQGLEPGGFAEYVKVPEAIAKKCLIKISNNVSFEEASLTEPLACCIKGLREAEFKPGDNILVIGCGPIGLMHTLLSKCFGARQIIAADIDEKRLEYASNFGADITVNPIKQSLEDEVKKYTRGIGVDIVMVDVPKFDAVKEAFKCVRKGGVICLFAGLPPMESQMPIDLNQIHYFEVKLVGSFGFTPRDFHLAYRLIESRRIDVSKLITHRIKLEQLLQGIELVKSHRALKVVVLM